MSVRFHLLPLMVLVSTAAGLPVRAEGPLRDPRFEAAAKLSREAGGIAMVVSVGGEIVFEEYAHGGAADRATEIASATKSFTGVLAACAVADGLLTFDEPAGDTLAEWSQDARRAITVRQLLSLTSGLKPGLPLALPSYGEAPRAKVTAPPGAKFEYGPVPFQIFGEILRRKLAVRGENVRDYLRRRILVPAGVAPASWREQGEGRPDLPAGAHLTARDCVRFGDWVARGCDGTVPPAVLAEIFHGTAVNPGYGIGWWLPGQGPLGREGSRRMTGLPADTYLAMGLGGQRILVVPSLRLVAVRLAPIRGLSDDFPGRDWLRAMLAPFARAPG